MTCLPKAILVFLCGLAFLGTSATAQITLAPGQSQTITCSSTGGGGGTTLACISDLSGWCYSHTSMNQDRCYELASQYCPSTTYSQCVSETAAYCYSHTSMNQDACFNSALGTCRGNFDHIRRLMMQVDKAARQSEKGVDITTQKNQEAAK